MIIDFHTHIFPPDVSLNRENYFSDSGFKILYSDEKSRLITREKLLHYIEENSIDYAVAMSFPWQDRKNSDSHNSYMAEAAADSGGRVITFGIPHVDENIENSVRHMKEAGVTGIGELAFYESGLSDKNFNYLERVFSAAFDCEMPVCIHVNEPVGHLYPGKYEPSLGKIYKLIEKFPELKIVLSHWGGGFFIYELMPEIGKLCRNVYYDTAASPYLYDSRIYETASEIAAKRILFGSDYPLLGIKRYLREAQEAGLSEDLRAGIFGKNASDLLKIQ